LPDVIKTNDCSYVENGTIYYLGCWDVFFNSGQGFGSPITVEVPQLFGDPQVGGLQNTHTDLLDINGDGLPDFNWIGPNGWMVLLNLGGTFEPVTFVEGSGNSMEAWPTRVWNGLDGPIRVTSTNGRDTIVDMIDLNGDGLLDRVDATTSPWTVELNQMLDPNARSQRPNLLAVMENGLGGTSNVLYEPSTRYDNTGGDGAPDLPSITWVVAGIRQSDGFCTAAGANVFDPQQNGCIATGNDMVSEYIYQDGRFDAPSREFRGFRMVARRAIEEVVGSGANAVASRNDTVTYFGQDDMTKGLLISTFRYGDIVEEGSTPALVADQFNQWSVQEVLSSPEKRWQVSLGRKTEHRRDSNLGNHTVYSETEVDQYGNVTHSWRHGPSDADRLDTYTSYANPNSSSFAVHDKPYLTETKAGTTLLERKSFYYDGGADGLSPGLVEKGNVKRVVSYLNAVSDPTVRMSYDAYGNVTDTIDPNSGHTSSHYGAQALYAETTQNALDHPMITETDYRWGKPTNVTDANGAVTQYAYDEAGRLICTALPGDSLQSCTTHYVYTFASQPGEYSTVRIEQKQSPNPALATTHYFDALGRKRYTDTFRVVDGQGRTVRSDDVDFDAGGRITARYDPYIPALGTRNNGQTHFDYHLNGVSYIDPLGRLHETTYSDGTTTRTEYDGSLVTSYDQVGAKTERLYDTHERLVKETVFNGASVYAYTEYTYDGLGRLLTSMQNGNTNTRITNLYDTLGRKVQTIDPDSGTWTYGYDANDNLIRQDDPRPNQHVQTCYDALNRPVRRCRVGTDYLGMVPCNIPCDSEEVHYEYDVGHGGAVDNSIGRLTWVSDLTGEYRVDAYDERGRVTQATRRIDSDNLATDAHMSFEYNEADQITSMTYPDGEVVSTDYDASGQPVALSSNAGTTFVSDVRYDIFGRILDLEHGNGVADTRTYYGANKRHRLENLQTASATETHLHLLYYSYTSRGQIDRIVDQRHFQTPLTNDANFVYDHLGRLTQIFGAAPLPQKTYAYSSLGNLTQKGSLTFQYLSPTEPHQMTSYRVNGGSQTAVAHDDNGNREDNGAGGQLYGYDREDRLQSIDLGGGQSVRFAYDHQGQMTVKEIGDPALVWTRYYNQYVETTSAGLMTKWYFLGGRRVASLTSSDAAWQYAALESAVKLAARWAGRPVMIVALRPDVQIGGGIVLLVVAMGLVVAPWRRKAVVGIAVRKGHAIGIVLLFTFGTFPWPLMVRPANAQCQGCECPTPTPIPAPQLRHYHLDHLGSTQVVTDEGGSIAEQIRYTPYGEIRGRWDANDMLITSPDPDRRHEFTGYETEILSGLQYAGARFYDPVLGSFLTHDPARQFANPYSYGGGDPLNWTDPTGRLFGLDDITVVLIVAALAGVASAIDTGIRTGDVGAALEAGATGYLAGIAGVGLGFVAGPVIRQLPTIVQYSIALGGGGYGVSQAVENGYYATAVVGSFAALLAAYGIFQGGKWGDRTGRVRRRLA
jgi:RHS repeat-associated protein